MSKEYVLKEVSLTGLVAWLNENHKKQNGKSFTVSDAQQYACKTGHLPIYMGGNNIQRHPKTRLKQQTYSILK